jgi:hypothetical protein
MDNSKMNIKFTLWLLTYNERLEQCYIGVGGEPRNLETTDVDEVVKSKNYLQALFPNNTYFIGETYE